MTFQYAERLIDAIGGHSVVINHLGEALNRTLFALMVFLIQPFYLSKDHLTCCSFHPMIALSLVHLKSSLS
jgi:hypothetical protein